jgi:ATP-dependent Clp protease ATP-binding subunit ClpC
VFDFGHLVWHLASSPSDYFLLLDIWFVFNYMKTIQHHLDTFRPVMTYEKNLGRTSLTSLRIIFFILFICCSITILVTKQAGGEYSGALLGSTLIFFALWLEQILLYCYHNSFYFRGFDSQIGSAGKNASGISYEVAQILLQNEEDITAAFIESPLGMEVLVRSGLSPETCLEFIKTSRQFLPATSIPLQTTNTTDIFNLGEYIYMYDSSFKQWLKDNTVTQTLFIGALQFVAKNYVALKCKKRWWSRDQLSLRSGIGRKLSIGVPYELARFSYPLTTYDRAIDLTASTISHGKIITKIEEILARSRSANILLIGEGGTEAIDILASVQARVGKGVGLNALAGLEFFVLNYKQLLAAHHEKFAFENELRLILEQAANTGTYVIVIPELSHCIAEAARIEVDIPELLTGYLALPTLHCIGIDTPHNYHTKLHLADSFVRRFEEVLLEGSNISDTIKILEPIALRQERRRGVLFTYGAICSIAENADRYLTNGVMPERAIDLIHQIAHAAQKKGVVTIKNEFVDTFVSEKIGMPVGPISPAEQDQLLNLENILHERVIGQEKAVSAIARTMRRARVDIARADKPIGTFLFLGGTGVGKTETAKALAYTFFGSEDKMIRFDMSEYSGEYTLGYLIGDNNGTGSLTDKLQEHPYSVVLLDEFEKAAESVHDLFLQILDEGYFTSTDGRRINARNTIIVATSNAGSDLIRKTTALRNGLPILDSDIINHIIETRVFKPELINRFDSTIIFEPLEKDELTKVAKLMLNELSKRVLNQGYYLAVTPALLALLVEKGHDPNSGGRGINRILQDVLEEKIAKKIIGSEVRSGGNLHLDVTDFSAEELAV